VGSGRNTPARAFSRTGSHRRRHSIDPRQLPHPRSPVDSNGTSTRDQWLGAVIGGCRRNGSGKSGDWTSLRRDRRTSDGIQPCAPDNSTSNTRKERKLMYISEPFILYFQWLTGSTRRLANRMLRTIDFILLKRHALLGGENPSSTQQSIF
jgi:hypothetical protein